MIKRDEFDRIDNYFRGLRGGVWLGLGGIFPEGMAASSRPAVGCDGGSNPTCASLGWGFRVASITNIPEPSSLLLGALAAAGLLLRFQGFR